MAARIQCGMLISERVATRVADLTPAESRVAEQLLARPDAVAFGTVAELARTAGASGATVLRLAAKLGFDGFVALQGAVQQELAAQLGPAAQRIRQAAADNILVQAAAAEVRNVQSTLLEADGASFREAVKALADLSRRVVVCAGDGSRGVGYLLGDQLLALRPDVTLAGGNPVRLGRDLASLRARDVLVVLDVRRYDRTVVDAAEVGRGRDACVVSLSDSRLGPLARQSHHAFVVHAGAVGPFDSQVGMLAFAQALVAGVAEELRDNAASRLDGAEVVWRHSGALTD